MHALIALVKKDLRLYFSNRRAVLVTLAAPILIAAFFGSVLGGSPKAPSAIPVALVDEDGSEISRATVSALRADRTLKIEEPDAATAREHVGAGKVRVAVVIPRGFAAQALRALFQPGEAKPRVELLVDPSQAMVAGMVKGLVIERAMQQVGRAAFATRPGAADAFSTPFEFHATEITSGNRAYNAFAHSFAGMGVQFVLFMGIELGVGVLLMRRQGIWKRLRAAPISRGLLLGSRIVSGTLIASILLACIYAAGIAFFGVRIDGSVVGFVGIALAFAVMTSTFGLLIAAIGRTPEATRGLAILATLLLVMLGGAWVPAFIFPAWLQKVTLWTPTRWAVDGLEAMSWRGMGIEAAWAPVAVLLAFGAVFAWVAVKRFQWEE